MPCWRERGQRRGYGEGKVKEGVGGKGIGLASRVSGHSLDT